jgi:hypothetical protein
MGESMKPIFKAYNIVRSSDENWVVLYKEAYKLALENNSEIDINKKDFPFVCILYWRFSSQLNTIQGNSLTHSTVPNGTIL